MMIGPQPRVAKQINVLGDPQNLLGREPLPAMRTGHLRQKPDQPGIPPRISPRKSGHIGIPPGASALKRLKTDGRRVIASIQSCTQSDVH